jgi:hypothetical protein
MGVYRGYESQNPDHLLPNHQQVTSTNSNKKSSRFAHNSVLNRMTLYPSHQDHQHHPKIIISKSIQVSSHQSTLHLLISHHRTNADHQVVNRWDRHRRTHTLPHRICLHHTSHRTNKYSPLHDTHDRLTDIRTRSHHNRRRTISIML